MTYCYDRDQAVSAAVKASTFLFQLDPRIMGVSILAGPGGGYCVSVLVNARTGTRLDSIPEEIDDVPVSLEYLPKTN